MLAAGASNRPNVRERGPNGSLFFLALGRRQLPKMKNVG